MPQLSRSLIVAGALAALTVPAARAEEHGAWEALKALVLGPAHAEEFFWKGRLETGKSLEIKGINGSVEVEPALGGEIEIAAERRGRGDDPGDVAIELVEHADGLTVCAVYPSPDARRNVCAPGDEGRMRVSDNDVVVEFRVLVPEGIDVIARTVNGNVTADELFGRAEAYTVNGSVKVRAGGAVRAETVNGSIVAAMGRADWSGHAAFETVNGSITLELPADADVDVRGSTVNGGISTELPLTVSGRYGPKRVRGTLGAGGRDLELSTVNGSIRIRAAR